VALGHHQHAVDLGEPGDRAHHPAGVHVDLDDFTGAQVRDEQQPAAGVEAGVIEAGAIPGKRDLRYLVQRRRSRW